MYLNQFKITLRKLLRNKLFTAINIIGLAVSIAVAFCIIVYVTYQLSYDKHHNNYDNIYRIESKWKSIDYRLPMTFVPMGQAIKDEIPGVKDFARFRYKEDLEFINKNTSIKIEKNYFADPSIFNLFSYSFIQGSSKEFNSQLNSVILSEETALRIFGNKNALGEIISFEYDTSNVDVKVVGVIENENLPASITPEVILPFNLLLKLETRLSEDNWIDFNSVVTFLLIETPIDLQSLEKSLKRINDEKAANIENYVMDVFFTVTPLKETYFVNDQNNAPPFVPVVNKDKIAIYSIIAISVLLLACINYVLLSSVNSSKNNVEIGIRKVVGAQKRDIVYQTIFESIFILFLTLPLTLLLVEIIFPYFQNMIGLSINTPFYMNTTYIFGLLLLNILIGIVTGSYISYLQFKMKPIDIFKNKISSSLSHLGFRRFLLVFQLFVFVALLFCTIVLNEQMNYIVKKDLGFDDNNNVTIYCREIKGKEEAYKNSIAQNSGIIDYAFTLNHLPIVGGSKFKISGEEKRDQQFLMATPFIGNDYPRFLKMKLIDGKFPDENKKKRKVILNETAVKKLNYENPIGKYIYRFGKYRREIAAVVKDFHINTMRDEILPVAMDVGNFKYNLVLKIDPKRISETVSFLREKWSEFSNTPLDIEFADDKFEYLYKNELRFEKIIDFFTILAIFITSMGLFGLVVASTQQRTKEIGLRKVLGASLLDILILLSKEYVLLVIIGSVIALPIAFYFMNQWLNNFVYKIDLTANIYFASLLLTLIATLIITSVYGIKTALANPIDSLRDE